MGLSLIKLETEAADLLWARVAIHPEGPSPSPDLPTLCPNQATWLPTERDPEATQLASTVLG